MGNIIRTFKTPKTQIWKTKHNGVFALLIMLCHVLIDISIRSDHQFVIFYLLQSTAPHSKHTQFSVVSLHSWQGNLVIPFALASTSCDCTCFSTCGQSSRTWTANPCISPTFTWYAFLFMFASEQSCVKKMVFLLFTWRSLTMPACNNFKGLRLCNQMLLCIVNH